MLKKLILVSLLLISTTSFASTGPFGFNWGESLSKIKQRNIKLKEVQNDGNFLAFNCEGLKPINNTSDVFIVIHKKFGLVNITWYSKQFKPSKFIEMLKVYTDIDKTLNEKYGIGSKETIKIVGSDPQLHEFFTCIDQECSPRLASTWQDNETSILLKLQADESPYEFNDNSTANIILTYENGFKKAVQHSVESTKNELKDKL